MARPKRSAPAKPPLAEVPVEVRHSTEQPAGREAGTPLYSEAETPFYIGASSGASRARRTLKHNDTFAVFDSHGDIGASAGGPDGLFDRDTRFLSHLELLVNGAAPLLLCSAVKDNNLNYSVDLTNPDYRVEDRLLLPKDTVHIGRTIYLQDGSLRERLALTNYGSSAVQITITLAFASDFADIFEVRGLKRQRRGRASAAVVDSRNVVLSYRGLDGKQRSTALAFDPAPTELKETIATFELTLAPDSRRTIFVAASSREQLAQSTLSFFAGYVALSREIKAMARSVASIETSSIALNEILCRSMADIWMLTATTADGPYPYAGIPWYSTTFGRDGLITALNMLWIDPSLAAGVLKRLARFQATANDPAADAAPGKILHEMRDGEMANLGEVPFKLYYGSVDATPLFVLLAGAYGVRTADFDLLRGLWPAIEKALEWIDGPGDIDGDGFLEYARCKETGLANQGWKDSHDAIFHADGRLAEGPIALVEVQGYVFMAKQLLAVCARKLGMAERAQVLEAQAASLRERFEEAFWCESIGFYALALDGAKRRCEVRTSNAGHALATGIARADRAAIVAHGLMRSPFLSGWGIRTVAEGEGRYNPMSYHNGSIWPHDNAIIAQGFARYGLKQDAEAIFESLMAAASYMEHRRIPELYCGFRRQRGRGPTLYPVACSPQAWAASTPFSLLQSMLGLEFNHEARQIRLVNPTVPASAGDIIIRNLVLGSSSADFVVRHDGGAVSLQVLRTSGDLQVSLVYTNAAAGKGLVWRVAT